MIEVHDDATADLKRIQLIDTDAFFKLVVFLQQLKKDPQLFSKLLDNDFGRDGTEVMSVMKWHGVHRIERVPIWRVKAWDLEKQGLKYRIIYFYNWPDKTYNIMAIVKRDGFDYDDISHPIRQRVIKQVRKEFPKA